MKLLILCITTAYCIRLSTTRLVQRATDKPKIEMSSNGDKIDLSASKEVGPKIIHFYKDKVQVRTPREEEKLEMTNITIKNINLQAKSKKPLVKKPIPKYKDIDSDEDYQSKQTENRWRSSLFDNVEHEDEDFSLDDYDFDVNHDEFVGRGKPLEPRKEPKLAYEETKFDTVQKNKRNSIPNITSNKEEHKPLIKQTSKAINKRDDDYDDAFPTTTNILAGKSPTTYRDEASDDEKGTSSEYHNFVRNARSPFGIGTYVDKVGEKTSTFVTKILSFLPLFPQISQYRK